jgi:hypothetical protein
VARAKRTNRAEARRRYRATLIDDPELLEEEGVDADSRAIDKRPTTAGPRSAPAKASAPTAPARPNVLGALKGAFRPTDLRGDIAALPRLLRHRSFLIPLGLIVGLMAFVIATGAKELISITLVPYFLAPQPVAPVFLAGFLTPRASYLIGALLGVVSWIALVVLVSSPAIVQALAGTTAAPGLAPDILLGSLFWAIVGGAFYAAAAAWYKRFLALASPSRAARAARATSRPNDRARKRDSGDRPILARRR